MSHINEITLENKNDNEIKNKKEEFIVKNIKGIDNQIYILKIIKSENSIIFTVNFKEDFLGLIYKKENTLNDFYNYYNYLKQFHSIN